MQAAWAQVGEIRHANEALVRIQFGRYVGNPCTSSFYPGCRWGS